MFFIADKPLKKRKQDSYPQESGAEATDWPVIQGGNANCKLTPKKTSAANNGASRPALMVSIDLQRAGRLIGQPVVVLEAKQLCEGHVQRLKSKTDEVEDKVVENRPLITKQHADHIRKICTDGQPETLKQKQESRRESKHRHDGNTESGKGHSEDRRADARRQKHDKYSDLCQKEENIYNSHQSNVSQPETPQTMSKVEHHSKQGDKGRDRDREKEKERNRDRDREKEKESNRDREREKERNRDRDREKDLNKTRDREKDLNKNRDREKELNKTRDREKELNKNRDREKERNRDRDGEKERNRDRNGEKEKNRDKDREKERNRDRERDKEKKNKMSLENCSRDSPDGHIKFDSPKVKQDLNKKSSDLNSSILQNKKEKKSGNERIGCQPENKQPLESKPEFPAYLLGGMSGSLKNFVIPKLKRDGGDRESKYPNKLIEGWSEPLVRLERVSLAENLNKGSKPVVVLEKLSINEVKTIIKESRNAHRSRNRSSFGQSVKGMIYCFLNVHAKLQQMFYVQLDFVFISIACLSKNSFRHLSYHTN